jgi:hypothetical protein
MINELPRSKLTGYQDMATRIYPKVVTPACFNRGSSSGLPGFTTVREPHRPEGNRGIEAFGNAELIQRCWTKFSRLLLVWVFLVAGVGCGKEDAKPQTRPPAEVSVVKIEPTDTPVTFEFVVNRL